MSESSRIASRGIERAVRQVGDGWSLLILWEALNGTTRFDNFQIRLGVARNILSNRLAKLVDDGLLVKRPVRPGARRLEYRLTAHAEALRPVLELMDRWGNGAASGDGPASGTALNGRTVAETRH